MKIKRWLCILSLINVYVTSGAQTLNYKAVSPYGAAKFASNSPTASTQRLRENLRSELPIIVFIPGIMGSSLKWDGYTFGQDRIDGKKLAYRASSRPIPSTLNTFIVAAIDGTAPRAFSRLDIYGSSLDGLKEINEGRPVEEFAYDWRADIEESSRDLQKWLSQPSLKGRNVVFIAHSMGGLVLWRWFQLFDEGQRAVRSKRAIFVGSPIQGSCEAARMLINGYKAPKGSTLWEEYGTEMLFRDARAALFTFPSIFQLLPQYKRDRACISLQSAAGLSQQNHHEPDFWLGRQGRSGGMKGGESKTIAEFSALAGMDPATYETSVQRAIEAGARLRSEMSLEPPKDVQTVFLYSEKWPTVKASLIKTLASGWYSTTEGGSDELGDGRVLPPSARDDGYGNALTTTRWSVESPHGSLMKDPALFRYVRDNVVTEISAATMRALGNSLQLGDVNDILRSASFIIDPGAESPQSDDATRKAQIILADYNLKLVGPKFDARAVMLKAFGQTAATSPPENARLAASLYESALLLDPSDATGNDFKTLIDLRIGSNDAAKAVNITEWLTKSNPMYQSRRLQAWGVLKNRGVVNFSGNINLDAALGVSASQDIYYDKALERMTILPSAWPQGNLVCASGPC